MASRKRKPRSTYKTLAQQFEEGKEKKKAPTEPSPKTKKRFSLGGGHRCHRCSKIVGFAEQKKYEHDRERLIFHTGCFNIWYKNKQRSQTLWGAQYTPPRERKKSPNPSTSSPMSPESASTSTAPSLPPTLHPEHTLCYQDNETEKTMVLSHDESSGYVWDAQTGSLHLTFSLHDSAIIGAAITQDDDCGPVAVTLSRTGKVIDSETKTLPQQLKVANKSEFVKKRFYRELEYEKHETCEELKAKQWA